MMSTRLTAICSSKDRSLPVGRGWHALRRELATNLHALGIADKDIQAILRHSNIAATQSCYIKALTGVTAWLEGSLKTVE
jgi:hypothetical protein